MDNVVQTGEDISNNNNNNNNNVNVNLTNNKKNLDTIYSLFEPLKKTNLELKEEINVLEKKIKEISENNKCSICLTNEKKYIFIPCGHNCICESCNTKLIKSSLNFCCPICRTIGEIYKVY